MAENLDPSPLSRLSGALRPDWIRTTTARRVAAGALVLLAAAAALRPDPGGERVPTVVAARDLTPGITLTGDDVHVESRTAATLPDGATSSADTVVGQTLAGPARRGEVLTDVRLLSPRLAEASAGPDARVVPLHLADAALPDLMRPGDVVDVLAVGDDHEPGARATVIATAAVVVLVSERAAGPGSGGDRVVLVALPAPAANQVAGAALSQAVTITFH
jgi:Flp pilus assembly protein CpaB